ncbi:MAG: peptide-methionine (S)-S-oxide reductase MsrA [Muribaculaceae bacterium]|jgi:peptide methionine sulfoxide reductase msrA/msrB|nr:peptide-methionine (S)-S-oxide reductase MsrA [Muribaculaceae bacterium]
MTHEIYLAGGCFWGTEHFFKQIEGVIDTQVGYANGTVENPTYEQVCTHKTGHAETVKVVYDPEQIGLEFLLDMFFAAIDPTVEDQQGPDVGPQYRTGIYYTDAADLPVIERRVADESRRYEAEIVTEVLPLACFYPAEDYHQDYLDKNPDGYCHLPLRLFEFARKAKPRKA